MPPASEGPDSSMQRDRPWEGPEAGASLGPGKGKRPAGLQQGKDGTRRRGGAQMGRPWSSKGI